MTCLSMFAFATSSISLFHPTLSHVTPGSDYSSSSLRVLRSAAVVSFVIWLCFVVWRLVTHTDLFDCMSEDIEEESDRTKGDRPLYRPTQGPSQSLRRLRGVRPLRRSYTFYESYDLNAPFYRRPQQEIQLKSITWLYWSLGWLVHVLLLVLCIDSPVAVLLRFPSRFQTLFCLFGIPLLLKPRRYINAIARARPGSLDEAIEATLGTGVCVALAVGPILVITGWILSTPMTLVFGTFETAVYGVVVWMLMIFVRRQISTYIEGSLLVGM